MVDGRWPFARAVSRVARDGRSPRSSPPKRPVLASALVAQQNNQNGGEKAEKKTDRSAPPEGAVGTEPVVSTRLANKPAVGAPAVPPRSRDRRRSRPRCPFGRSRRGRLPPWPPQRLHLEKRLLPSGRAKPSRNHLPARRVRRGRRLRCPRPGRRRSRRQRRKRGKCPPSVLPRARFEPSRRQPQRPRKRLRSVLPRARFEP